MVRKRVPKTGRGRVDGSVMQRTVLEVENGKSVREVSKCLKVDRSTFSRYVKKVKSGLMPRDSTMLPKFNIRQVFSETEESCLADYILKCSAMFHGMGQEAVRRLAFQFGFRNGKRMPNNWQKDAKAGEDWMQGFLRRQNHLSLRKPEATSIARAQSFNQKAVDEFFNLIRKEMTRLHCSADNIYNLDESGITTVQSVPKVIAQKGLQQVGQITASERGCLVTVCCCVNAVGRVLPPAMIFPRVHYKSHMTHGRQQEHLVLLQAMAG